MNIIGHTIWSGNQCTMTSALWFPSVKTPTVSVTEWCRRWVWWDTWPSSCGAFYTVCVCVCIDFTRMWVCECPSVGRSGQKLMISCAASGWLMVFLAALLLLGVETRSHAQVRCAKNSDKQKRGRRLSWECFDVYFYIFLMSFSFSNQNN